MKCQKSRKCEALHEIREVLRYEKDRTDFQRWTVRVLYSLPK